MTQNKYYGNTGINSLKLGGNKQIGGLLTSAVASGKALGDDGQLYDSIQNAVDNSKGIVIIGPGNFNESVSITTAGMTLKGSGKGTVISSDSADAITVNSADVQIKDLSVETTADQYEGIKVSNSGFQLDNVKFPSTTSHAVLIQSGSNDFMITNCEFVKITNNPVIMVKADRGIIDSCILRPDTDNQNGIYIDSHDIIVSNCQIHYTDSSNFQNPIRTFGADNVFIGNQLTTHNGSVFRAGGSDEIAANNRMYATSGNYFGGGTISVDDDNLKGSRN